MTKKRVEMTVKKSAQKPVRTEKRKVKDSVSKMPKAREKSHGSSGIQSRKKVWEYMLPEEKWFFGKITTSMPKGVLTNIKRHLSEAQQTILKGTCFGHFMDCPDIALQSQLIHYFLLRQVHTPNEDELWFRVSGRYVRFSMVELCVITGLRCIGDSDVENLEDVPSVLKEKFISQLNSVTHEDVRDTFLSACQLPEQDVVEVLLDEDVAKLGALYFITSYLFPRDYKKVVDHYLFVLVEDFALMNKFPWGKLLFESTLNDLREGLSKRTRHYRLRGLLIPFQVWIYETIPSLDGSIVKRMSDTLPRIMNWVADEPPSAAKLEGDKCFSNPDIVIRDLDPSDTEMDMPYMNGLQYSQPVQPVAKRRAMRKKRRTERSARGVGTSDDAASRGVHMSSSVHRITDGSTGHGDVEEDDDDFQDPPPRWEDTTEHAKSPRTSRPSSEHFSAQEPHPSVPMSDNAVEDLRNELTGQITDLRSRLSHLQGEQLRRMDDIVQMQSGIRNDVLEIRTNMQFLSESVSALISSTMEEIMKRLSESSKDVHVGHAAEVSEKPGDASHVGSSLDTKGKGKMVPDEGDDIQLSLQPPSFDLGLDFTQLETQTPTQAQTIQQKVDCIISDVLQDTKMTEAEVSPVSEPSSGLPMKRVSRPARILQSPFVADEGKVLKHADNVLVFEHYNREADEADISLFQSWFQRGYKPRNKKKFNDADDVISPPFLLGGFKVGSKTWFHELVNFECSLSSMHMDVCFYYIRQLARYGKNAKLKATTTDSWFQMKLKNIYSKFKQDPTIISSESSLIDVVTKGTLPLSHPWSSVDHVFMPIIPTNKAHWMLAVLEFRTHTLHVFNSAGKTYHDFLLRIGIEPFLKIIPYLLNYVGLWKRHIDYDGEDRMDLRLMVDSSLPQQSNGHDCGIFTIKYAEYLLHDDKDSMPIKFDAGRARLDIATRLYKHRSIYKRR